MLTFGSLFAGIGGLDLGLERAGMACSWQVEIDDYATKILEKHWPNVTRFRDVQECGTHNLKPVDLVCGGFPCTDISVAGKGAGLAGQQSGLWFQFARIIHEIKPQWVLVENVRNLLAIDIGEAMGVILRDLAESGYDAWWDCIPAAAVGAPHQRDRVFIVAYSHADRGGRKGDQEFDGAEAADTAVWSPFWRHVDGLGDEVADAQEPRLENGRQTRAQPITDEKDGQVALTGFERRCQSWWASEPDVGRVAHGIPDRVDRLKCLGNAVVPQMAEFIGRAIIAAAARRGDGDVESGVGR